MHRAIFLLVSIFLLLGSCELVEQAQEEIIEISGKVTHNGNAITGAIVLLLKDPSFSDGLSLANGSLTDNAGRYTIYDVAPGNYYVLAIDDQDDNLRFDNGIDRFGFYGIDTTVQDFVPDKISVKDSDLKNIDITVFFATR